MVIRVVIVVVVALGDNEDMKSTSSTYNTIDLTQNPPQTLVTNE